MTPPDTTLRRALEEILQSLSLLHVAGRPIAILDGRLSRAITSAVQVLAAPVEDGWRPIDNALVERLAFEAMQWTRDPQHNPGNDQPSLVFARRFAFLLNGRSGVQPSAWLPNVLCPTDGVWRAHKLPDGSEVVASFQGQDLGPMVRRWRVKTFGYHNPSRPSGDVIGGVEQFTQPYDTFVIQDLPEGIYPTHFRPNDTVYGAPIIEPTPPRSAS